MTRRFTPLLFRVMRRGGAKQSWFEGETMWKERERESRETTRGKGERAR